MVVQQGHADDDIVERGDESHVLIDALANHIGRPPAADAVGYVLRAGEGVRRRPRSFADGADGVDIAVARFTDDSCHRPTPVAAHRRCDGWRGRGRRAASCTDRRR